MPDRISHTFSQLDQAVITPDQAFELLKQGNQRFVTGQPNIYDHLAQARSLEVAQFPWAVVLSCIDSRTAPEIIFDLGLGDIFNIRVPGNILSPVTLGGIEFAIAVAGVKLIAVIGHNSCGAVINACNHARSGNITYIVDALETVVDNVRRKNPGGTDSEYIINRVVEENVLHVMNKLPRRSLLIRERIDAGTLKIVGGIHDIGSGRVDWI